MTCIGASLLALIACLGNPDPAIRDKLAFEQLSTAMRAGDVDASTLSQMKSRLLEQVTAGEPVLASFSALTLSEVARTDRIRPWMSGDEREELVDTTAKFLANIRDYRAFSDPGGYVHAVAHGSDLALQLALNPAVTKPQLDRLLTAIASQIAPKDSSVAYWAGEPDRLARAVIYIAQRHLHSDAEWKAWFASVMNPSPIASWDVAFNSETGIRKVHNTRAFLLSVFVTTSTTGDAGIRQLLDPVRESLKLVP